MGLADAIATEGTKQRGPMCSVGRLIDSLPAEDAAVLRSALGDTTVLISNIHRALRREYPDRNVPSDHTLGRHRRGDCLCEAHR